MKLTYKVLSGDGKTIRDVEATPVSIESLPEYEFIAYRESGQAYWVIGEVLSGTRVNQPRATLKEAVANANERIRFVGINRTKSMICERAAIFAGLLAASSSN